MSRQKPRPRLRPYVGNKRDLLEAQKEVSVAAAEQKRGQGRDLGLAIVDISVHQGRVLDFVLSLLGNHWRA